MIPVYICDDELPIRRSLEQIVSNQILILDSDMGPVRALEDPEKLLELQKQDSVPAIYFLDIDFPGRMSGLELAQKLRQYDPRGFIVFITAHNDLAFETFRLRLEALDYIVKGSRDAMTMRVQSCLESIRERMEAQRPGQGNYCTVKILDTVRHIPIDSILYLEAVGHYVRLHQSSGETLEWKQSFSAVLAELPAEAFVRIHRSFCVNLMHVSRLTRKSCFLDEGMELPLSRSAYQEANEAFLRYYRKRDPFC